MRIPALAALLTGLAAWAGLTPEEAALARRARDLAPRAADTLTRLAALDSPTESLEGVRRMGKALGQEFEALGFKVRWVELPPAMKRAGHLVVEHEGTRGQRLLLIGHLDTVLPAWTPVRAGNRLSGSGVKDMKGGDVVMLYALKALAESGALQDRRIVAVFTGDEEAPAEPLETARAALMELARRSDVALAYESAEGDTGTIARRGIVDWRLDVKGNTGHSGDLFTPRMGYGAAYELARVLDGFRTTLAGEPNLTFNVGLLAGGATADLEGAQAKAFGKMNIVAGAAHAVGDLRFLSAEQRDRAMARMQSVAAASLPGTSAVLRFDPGYPAMAPTEGNRALLKVLDEASRDLGLGPTPALDPALRGAGDVSFVAHLVPALDGLGMAGGNEHAPGEWADLEAMPKLLQRSALLIYRLTR